MRREEARQTDRQTDRQRQRQKHTERETETERDRERQRQRERDRDRELAGYGLGWTLGEESAGGEVRFDFPTLPPTACKSRSEVDRFPPLCRQCLPCFVSGWGQNRSKGLKAACNFLPALHLHSFFFFLLSHWRGRSEKEWERKGR